MTSPSAPRANFNYPSSYRLGCGRLQELSQVCDELGIQRPLVVTDPGVVALPWFPRIAELLAASGRTCMIYSAVSENPTEGDVDRGVQLYRQEDCDGVLLVGGGSPHDVGKCIALLANNPGTTFDYEDVGDNYKRADPNKIARMVAIPTTAGTGSEVGRSSIITNEHHEKKVIFHPKMQPPIVLADPELTFGLPPHLTAFTGLDALIHSFEAYCAPGYHPMADGIALEGMRLIKGALPRAVAQGDDAPARTDMMLASSMGATAFQKGLGVVHAIAHALGGMLRVQHGMANAILLPYCMQFNRDVIELRCEVAAAHMGLRHASFDGLLAWVLDARSSFGVPHTLGELPAFTDDHPARLAPLAHVDPSLPTNPKPASIAELETLIKRAASGDLRA